MIAFDSLTLLFEEFVDEMDEILGRKWLLHKIDLIWISDSVETDEFVLENEEDRFSFTFSLLAYLLWIFADLTGCAFEASIFDSCMQESWCWEATVGDAAVMNPIFSRLNEDLPALLCGTRQAISLCELIPIIEQIDFLLFRCILGKDSYSATVFNWQLGDNNDCWISSLRPWRLLCDL